MDKKWFVLLWQLSLLFLALLLAIWLVTRDADAPQLILLLLLTIIAINFTLPPEHGLVGLVPVVAVSSVLVVGLPTAVLLTLISFAIAELARPLWDPLWDQVDVKRPSAAERFLIIILHLASLLLGGLLYQLSGGTAPLHAEEGANLRSLVGLGLGYGASYLLFILLHQLLMRRPLRPFLLANGLSLLTAALLAQPFAIFGGLTFARSGLPFFVVFSLGVMLFSLLNWVSWQRRFMAEQQLRQFTRLNDASLSLRERLELPVVLQRTKQHVSELVSIDEFVIFLTTSHADWQFFPGPNGQLATAVPDDFTRWVASQRRLLHIHGRNVHYASRHNLTPPAPLPATWLGIPLLGGEQVIGVMALQRHRNGAPFNRWDQEMLLALAGQVSAAVQNAQLFSETVRLYNLTDAALARRVEQLQALLNTVAEGVLLLDNAGYVLLVNPMAAHLLQQSAAALQGHPLSTETAVTHLGYTAEAWQQQFHLLQEQQPPPTETTLFMKQEVTADAGPESRRFFTRSAAAVYAQSGQVMGWLIVLRDVTEEQALAEQRADLARMIVHDLRNPVTTLVSTLRQVEQKIPSQPNSAQTGVQELLQNAQHTCADLLDMVDSLMDVNRMEAGQLQPESDAMRLPPLVERVLARLSPLAQQRQIALRYTSTPDLPPVWADEELTRRVLLNLLDNALKFSPAGGEVVVDLRRETAVAPHHEPGVRCTITDSGPGIPPEFRQRIFDRFLRTNRGGAQVRGTGLGLTFCKMAVEAQHGRIWSEDAPGVGSRFIFVLPGIPSWEEIHM